MAHAYRTWQVLPTARKAYLAAKRTRGECLLCTDPVHVDDDGVCFSCCKRCLDQIATNGSRRYAERKMLGLCVSCGAQTQPKANGTHPARCPKHKDAVKKLDSARYSSRMALRASRKAEVDAWLKEHGYRFRSDAIADIAHNENYGAMSTDERSLWRRNMAEKLGVADYTVYRLLVRIYG